TRRRRSCRTIACLAKMLPRAKERSDAMNRRDFLVGSALATGLPAMVRAQAQPRAAAASAPIPDVKVLVFDTFGTVVDWRSAVIAEGQKLGRAKGLKVDWAAFADAWRAGYGPS